MPPTLPVPNPPDKRPALARPNTGERRSELVCRVKYCNTLPDIPFDPKFITYPFESTRFIQYNPTSLERNYRYEVLTEHDLGVTIDLINKDVYTADPNGSLDPADEKLLEEDILLPHDSKRSVHHSRSVSWLRRTEYISTEQTRFQPQTMDKVEAKVGFRIKQSLKEETLFMDRETQIKEIEKTFEEAKKPIEKHYSKANVVPVEVLPIFPDYKMWKFPCAQVIFDADPAPVGRPVPAQIEEMSQALIRGVMDESGEQFVAYFLPTESTLEKRRRDFIEEVPYVDEEEYDYKIAREYNWNVKTKASKGYEENYFFVMHQDAAFYNELETRVRLNKRRQKIGQAPNNTRLSVKHRPLDASEFNVYRLRERQLEPPYEEDEEEEEDDEEEEDKEENKGEEKRGKESGSEKEASDSEREESEKEEKSGSEAESDNEKKSASEDEGERNSGSGSEGEKTSRASSRSRSRSRSKSRTPSRSPSPAVSRSRSKSKSKSPQRSKSRSRSKSSSRSRSSGSESNSQSD